jgi:hypothetical protein
VFQVHFRRSLHVMERQERATAYHMRSRRVQRTLLPKLNKWTIHDWVLRGKEENRLVNVGHGSNIFTVYEGVVHDALPDTTDRQTHRQTDSGTRGPHSDSSRELNLTPHQQKREHPTHAADTTPQQNCLETLNEQN